MIIEIGDADYNDDESWSQERRWWTTSPTTLKTSGTAASSQRFATIDLDYDQFDGDSMGIVIMIIINHAFSHIPPMSGG